MRCRSILYAAALLLGAAAASGAEAFRQRYPVDEAVAVRNRRLVEADQARAPDAWKTAALCYYVVPPLSDIPRTPERYPADGEAFGELTVIATPGEFEPASLVITPLQPVDRFLPRAGDLIGPSGARIPADALDIKVIKVWYQSGAAWYGYFADALGRRLVPELLLNDETLIRVDAETRDNYVRYLNKDGTTHDQWMSANFMIVNDTFANQANQGLIQDADTLQPVVLNPGEFKQFFVTVRVPTNAAAGLYTGRIDLLADGRDAGSIPLRLRVLPFTLPDPKTNYDPDKTFYLSLYGTASSNPKVLRNLAEHNARHPMGFPAVNTMNPARFADDIRLAREAGLSTRPLFSGTASVGITADPDQPSGEERRRLEVLRRQIADTAELSSRHLGHTDFYSYGVDEGGPSVIRREQAAWRTAHEAGGKVMVSSYPWRRLLFALDFMIMPGMPVEKRAGEVRKFHEANPDALCGWYANPHSGPENPNYFRRIHGLQAYKMNYDVSANYCWWRNNWNDMATPYENTLRNIVMVLGTADDVIDTLAWEGVREGLDDIRYATALRERAREALKHPDGGRRLLGRRALGFLAYWDEQRDDLDAFRSETIRYILELDEAPKGGRP